MLNSIVAGKHSSFARVSAFILVIAMLITCVVPTSLSNVYADGDTTGLFKFAKDADGTEILKSYSYTKEGDSEDEEATLKDALDSDNAEVFDIDAVLQAYEDSVGEKPVSWYVGEDKETTFDKDTISDMVVDFGGEVIFTPIFEEKTTPEPEPEPIITPQKADEFTVSFDVEGTIKKSVKVTDGDKVPSEFADYVPEIPSNAVAFNGWFTKATGGEKVDFDKFVVTEDTTIYAQFRDEYIVRWVNNTSGKDVVIESELVKKGGFMPDFSGVKVDQTYKDTVTGKVYNFKGWKYEDSTGNMVPYDNTDPNLLYVNRDIDFYTDYSDKWTVIFVSEGTRVDSQLVDVDGLIDTSGGKATTTREGYDFTKWVVKNAAGNFEDFDITKDKVTKDLVLYARWQGKEVDYQVVYWFEKPNTYANEMTDTQKADKENYRYFTTHNLKATAGEAINVENGVDKTPKVNGQQLDPLTVEHPHRPMYDVTYAAVRVGDYTGVNTNNSDDKILGTGGTVINVYFSRTIFDIGFRINPTTGGAATLQFNGDSTVYRQTERDNGATIYNFKAKYEQDISDKWPSYQIADIKRLEPNGTESDEQFSFWRADDNDEEDWITPRYTLNNQLLPLHGQSKVFGSIDRKNVKQKKVNYYLECLPGERPAGTKSCVIDGVTRYFYLPADNTQIYGQGDGALGAKKITGFTVTTQENSSTEDCYYEVVGDTLVAYPDSTPQEDLEVNFAYARNSYTLKFDTSNGVSLNANAKAQSLGYEASENGYKDKVLYEATMDEYVTDGAVTASKANHDFEGWYYDAEYRLPFEAGDIQPADEVKLFAKMKSLDNKVRYFGSTADNTDDKALKIMTTADNSYITASDSPAGYDKGSVIPGVGVFNGWKYRDSATNQLLPFSYEMPIRGALDLYASYDLFDFKLTYETGEGTGTAPTDNFKYRFGENGRLATQGSMVAPSGKVFIGWQKKNSDGSLGPDVNYAKAPYPVEGDTTMVAKWGKPSDYDASITYHRNINSSDTVKEGPYYFNINDQTKLIDVGFENKPQTQLGWSDNAKDKTPKYGMTDDFTVTGHHDLYAIWDFSGFTVKFIADTNGTLDDGSDSKTFDSIAKNTKWKDAITTVPGVIPDNNYYFDGWELVSGSATGTPGADGLPDGDMVIEDDLTYKAKFARKATPTITAESDSKTYDGTPLTNNNANAANLHAGDTLKTVTMSAASTITTVGSVDNVITKYLIVDNNGKSANHKYFDATLVKGTLEVKKRTVTITAASERFEYDETEHSNSSYSAVGLLPGHEIKSGVTVEGKITYPGTVTNKAIASNVVVADAANNSFAENYEFKTVDGTLEVYIKKESLNIRIVGNTSAGIYNANEQIVTGYAVYGPNGSKTNDYVLEDLSKDEAKGTDAAHYDMNLTKGANFKIIKDGHDVTEAYKVTIIDGYLDIAKRPIWVKAGSWNFPLSDTGKDNVYHVMDSYQAQTANGGLLSGQTISAIEFSTSSVIRNASESPVANIITDITVMDGTDNVSKNYKVDYQNGVLEMSAIGEWVAEITGTSDTKVYNATTQSIKGFTDNISKYVTDYKVIVPTGSDIATGKNAGTYPQELEKNASNIKIMGKFPGDTDYKDITNYFKDINVTNGALTITKCQLEYEAINQTIPVGGSFTLPGFKEGTFPADATQAEKDEVYKRTGVTESGYLRMLVDGGDLSDYSTLDTSKAGEYDLTWSNSGATLQNYDVNGKPGTLKVYDKPVKEVISGPTTEGSVKVGDTITYKITYTNSYNEIADVVVKDKLAESVDFVSASGLGTYDAVTRTVTWTFSDVAPNGTGSVELTVKVNDKALVEIDNVATVQVGNHNPDVSNTTKTKVKPEDPKKEVVSGAGISGGAVNVGDEMVYAITYQNYATSAATVVITDQLPKGVDFVSATGNYSLSGTRTVVWTMNNVPSGAEGTVYVTVKVNKDAIVKIENEATVKVGDNNPLTSNKVTNDVNPNKPEKELIEGAPASGGALQVGSTIKYKIRYGNFDKSPADIVVTDTLDKGLTYVSSNPAGNYTSSNNTVKWEFKNVPSGEFGEIILTVKVNEKALVEVDNTAEVKVGNHAPQTSNTVKTKVDPEKPKKEVVTGAGVGGTTVKVGDYMLYGITYRNFEKDTADIVIKDKLPAGVDYISCSVPGRYDSSSHTVTWNLKDVASGEGGTVFVAVRVNASAAVTVENVAEVIIGENTVTSNKTTNPVGDVQGETTPPSDPNDGTVQGEEGRDDDSSVLGDSARTADNMDTSMLLALALLALVILVGMIRKRKIDNDC